MNKIFLLSIILKGIGAILEVLLQIIVTKRMGVDGYGSYATWVNMADLVFWVGFSGLIKNNTFYLSGGSKTIHDFKKKYYGLYAFPILLVIAIGALIFTKNPLTSFVFVITGLELLVLDNSSTLLAQGKVGISLLGEYIIGRLFMVLSVLVLSYKGMLSINMLIYCYMIQYILVFALLFHRKEKRKNCQDISSTVSLRKWANYQKSDLMHSMIEQMPVVVQFFFSNAFEAGVVSIVLLVKRLINFISGPTAKVFLPEFSRMYKSGEKEKICEYYASVMRIQMLAVGPLAILLLGYPKVILKILAEELTQYAGLFMCCSIIFLMVSTLGPCGGFLQMTGNEKKDNRCRELALVIMVIVMALTYQNSYFVLYGLCVQVALEAIGKYIVVCQWMGHSPVGIIEYLKWWCVPCFCIIVTYLFRWQDSFIAMILVAGIAFILKLMQELKQGKEMLRF